MRPRIFTIICILLCAVLLGVPMAGLADTGPEDPVEALEEDERYTPEAFDALSDEDKRDVYNNHPKMLPEGFDVTQYWDVMHPSE